VKCTAKDDKNTTIGVATFTVQVKDKPNRSFFFNPGGYIEMILPIQQRT